MTTKASAAALVSAAMEKARPRAPAMSDAARKELETVLAYNDTVPRMARVSADDMRKLLKEEHGWDHGHGTLSRYCAEVLGRKSWAEP